MLSLSSPTIERAVDGPVLTVEADRATLGGFGLELITSWATRVTEVESGAILTTEHTETRLRWRVTFTDRETALAWYDSVTLVPVRIGRAD